jgi:hypothetical protein
MIFIPQIVLGNPFVNIIPGIACVEVDEIESHEYHESKNSVVLKGLLTTIVKREYLGYKSRSFYGCDENHISNYSFSLGISSEIEAHELLKNWLPFLTYSLGNPSYNSLVSPDKEHFHQNILDGISKSGEVLVQWQGENFSSAFLTVSRLSGDYEFYWSWQL